VFVVRHDDLRVFISAGESSGDLHASRLIEKLKQMGNVSVEAVGGKRMADAGARIVFPMEKISVVGLSEVAVKLPALLQAFLRLRRHWKRHRPDLFIPVDFPGFNLRLAHTAKSLGIPVMYYVAPQVWAWGAGRLEALKKSVDKMVVVLPFEKELYERHGIPVEYVGHPLVDSVASGSDGAAFRKLLGFDAEAPLIGLLPGSRWHEVARLLPPMIGAFKELKVRHPTCMAAIGLADTIPELRVRRLAREGGINLPIVTDRTYDLIEASDVILAASGTVTLEAALLQTPMVIVYGLSQLSWAVARRVVKTESVGLVNIVAGRRVVPEYLQKEVVPFKLAGELDSMLFDVSRRQAVLEELSRVKELLGAPGASERAAAVAIEIAQRRGARSGWAGRRGNRP
jgi:lipid-A-disaccharide synthase